MTEISLAILGAGTFGLSTALAWRKTHPSARISLIDVKPSPLVRTEVNANNIIPASEDVGKIIRAAYASPEYAQLASEALEIWHSESPYRDYFHQSGWVVANELTEAEISITEGNPIGRERYEEAFPASSLDDGYVITEDTEPGWVEASKCLEAVLRVAMDQGIEYVSGEAVGLLWQESRCTGIKMRDGKEISAENIVLAMGPWTPGFLQKCGVAASIPCEVAGVTAVSVKLDENEYRTYKDMPILMIPGAGEIMPPDRNRIIKINNTTAFYAPDISSLKISTQENPYFEENMAMLRKFLPALSSVPVVVRRHCFDMVTTPAQDFVISAIPELEHLFVAAGGSFHGWKFLPNIGRYVVKMIEGTLHPPWTELWRIGGTPSEHPIHLEVMPVRPFI